MEATTVPVKRKGAPRGNDQRWPALREAMDKQNVKVDQLAREIGRSRRAILSYIYGPVTPPVDVVISMARALDTTEEALRVNGPLPPIEKLI